MVKGDFTSHVSSSQHVNFQRRTERLDWRKIASIDLEKVILDGDVEQLEEYTRPILYCKADCEFDLEKTDPGFIKVFRISQLIGEYYQNLLTMQEKKIQETEARCKELEISQEKLLKEIAELRDSTVGTKKELKRTKEMLATTQSELLGVGNPDEYDQCPYCNKKFLAPFYLHAHIQRRHQGLPLPPFGSSNINLNNASPGPATIYTVNKNFHHHNPPIPSSLFGSQQLHQHPGELLDSGSVRSDAIVLRRESQTQTLESFQNNATTPIAASFHKRDSEIQTVAEHIDNNTSEIHFIKSPPKEFHSSEELVSQKVQEIVDSYIQTKYGDKLKLSEKDLQVKQHSELSENVFPASEDNTKLAHPQASESLNHLDNKLSSLESKEDEISRMRSEFEKQWASLESRIKDSGIDELKTSFLTEIKKVQEMISESSQGKSETLQEKKETVVMLSEQGDADTNTPAKNIDNLKTNEKEPNEITNNSSPDQKKKTDELENLKKRLEDHEEIWRTRLLEIEEKFLKARTLENEEEVKRSLENVEAFPDEMHSKIVTVVKHEAPITHKILQPEERPVPKPRVSTKRSVVTEDIDDFKEKDPDDKKFSQRPSSRPKMKPEYTEEEYYSSSGETEETPIPKLVFDPETEKLVDEKSMKTKSAKNPTSSEDFIDRPQIDVSQNDSDLSISSSVSTTVKKVQEAVAQDAKLVEEGRALKKAMEKDAKLQSMIQSGLKGGASDNRRSSNPLHNLLNKMKRSGSIWKNKMMFGRKSQNKSPTETTSSKKFLSKFSSQGRQSTRSNNKQSKHDKVTVQTADDSGEESDNDEDIYNQKKLPSAFKKLHHSQGKPSPKRITVKSNLKSSKTPSPTHCAVKEFRAGSGRGVTKRHSTMYGVETDDDDSLDSKSDEKFSRFEGTRKAFMVHSANSQAFHTQRTRRSTTEENPISKPPILNRITSPTPSSKSEASLNSGDTSVWETEEEEVEEDKGSQVGTLSRSESSDPLENVKFKTKYSKPAATTSNKQSKASSQTVKRPAKNSSDNSWDRE